MTPERKLAILTIYQALTMAEEQTDNPELREKIREAYRGLNILSEAIHVKWQDRHKLLCYECSQQVFRS